MALTEEIAIHDQHRARLTAKTSPTLREGFGVGSHTKAELLIICGDNPDRIRSEAALYRAVVVRMRYHQPTVDYVARRTADGRTKREIIRCLKHFLAREIYQRVMTDFRARQKIIQAA